MDVIFETSRGRNFTIEIGFFDTVLEIKEKVQRYEGYPVSSQKLVFKGQELLDDRDTEHYEILQGSRLQLIVVAETDDGRQVKIEDSGRIHVIVKIPISKRQLSLEVDVMDSVSRMKERIQECEGFPVNRFALFYGSIEMQDTRVLAEYGVAEHSEVNVVVRPCPPAATSASKKLKLLVLPKCGTKKIPVEVNASDNVSELRKELQRLHAHLQFHLPSEGYFFIYKQNVMDDDRTFRWHDVRPGDTIEIFNGSVTGGS